MTPAVRFIVASVIAVGIGGPVISPPIAQTARPKVPHYAGPRDDVPVPRPGMMLRPGRFGLVVTDPAE